MKVFMKTHVCPPCFVLWRHKLPRLGGAITLGTFCLALFGCASDRPKPLVSDIVFTDGLGHPQAVPSELKAGSGTYLDVVVSNDSELLGANWSVSCSNQPPAGTPLPPNQPVDMSCGTFTPVHTLTGPVPTYATSGAGIVTFYTAPAMVPKDGTVTLYASATSDPSQNSSIKLTIISQ
jgi:hypothetical protein